jgi:hypothetical protein
MWGSRVKKPNCDKSYFDKVALVAKRWHVCEIATKFSSADENNLHLDRPFQQRRRLSPPGSGLLTIL